MRIGGFPVPQLGPSIPSDHVAPASVPLGCAFSEKALSLCAQDLCRAVWELLSVRCEFPVCWPWYWMSCAQVGSQNSHVTWPPQGHEHTVGASPASLGNSWKSGWLGCH